MDIRDLFKKIPKPPSAFSKVGEFLQSSLAKNIKGVSKPLVTASQKPLVKTVTKPISSILNERNKTFSEMFARQKAGEALKMPTKEVIDIGLDILPVAPAARLTRKLTSQAAKAAGPVVEEISKASRGLIDDLKLPSNIRLDKLDLDETGVKQIKEAISNAGNFVQQRRGKQSFDAIKASAKEVLPKIKLAPGKILNAEESVALGNVVSGYQTKINDLSNNLADAVNSGKATDVMRLELQKVIADRNVALASLSGVKAEVGRALSAQRILNQALDPAAVKEMNLIKKATEYLGGPEKTDEIAKKIASFGKDELSKMKFVQSLNKPGFSDYIDWYYFVNLLSGPKTHIRNIVGTGGNIAYRTVSKPFAAAVDSAKVAVKGGDRSVYAGELPKEIYGLFNGMSEGWEKAMYMVKNGMTMEDVTLTELRAPKEIAIGTKFEIPANIVSRAMMGADLFMKSIAGNSELYSMAYTAGKKNKLVGDDLKKFIDNYVDNPPIEAIKKMKEVADVDTFTNKLGKNAEAFNKMRQNIPININGKGYTVWNPVKLVIPFYRTLVNIMARGAEATPVGFITGALKETPRARSQAQGKALLGTLTSAMFMKMAAEGRISGNGPSNKEMRDNLYATGWRPNSIRVGDKWVSFNLLQPLNVQLSIIGNAHDAYVYDKKDPNIGKVLGKTINSFVDTSMLSGVQRLLNGLNYGDISQFFNQAASSFTPLSSLQRSIRGVVDPKIRERDGIKDEIMNIIPGLSSKLPAQTNIGGEEIKYQGGPLKRLLDPFNITTIPDEGVEGRNKDVVEFINNLGEQAPSITTDIKIKDPVTGERKTASKQIQRKYKELFGKQYFQVAGQLIKSNEFKSLPDDAKIEALEKVEKEIKDGLKKQIEQAALLNALKN